jgi:hypothetical protein
MNRYVWHTEKYVPLLMTYGFTLHDASHRTPRRFLQSSAEKTG